MHAAGILQATLQTMQRGESWADQPSEYRGHGIPICGIILL